MSDLLPDIKELCRLCLNKGENKCVFDRDETNQQITFIIKIQDCVSIEITRNNDDLPTVVCRDCENFVNRWSVFKDRCNKAQLTLKKWRANKELAKTEIKLIEDGDNSKAQEREAPLVAGKDLLEEHGGSCARDNVDGGKLFNDCNPGVVQVGENEILSKFCEDNQDKKNDIIEIDKRNNQIVTEEINTLDQKVTSTVSSSSNKDSSDSSQSSCHAIKIASTVSLPKGFFEGNFDDLNTKPNLEKSDDIYKQSCKINSNINDVTIQNGETTRNNDELAFSDVEKEGNHIDNRDKGNGVDINSSTENVGTPERITLNEANVPDSTITSPKEQNAELIMQVVASIKTEPVDEQDLNESSTRTGEIRVKTEPEELVDEHVVTNQEDEIDLTTNKCTVCNYVFSSNNSLMRHLSSRKHIRRTLPPEALKTETTGPDNLGSEILPDNAVRSTRQKSKGFSNSFDGAFTDDSQEAYLDDSFFCRICNRTYCSSSELKRHNRSMKHMRNLSIRAALKRKANRQQLEEEFARNMVNASAYGLSGRMPSHLQKDYICPMENCTFSCKEGSILLEHMMVHGIRNNGSDALDKPIMSPPPPSAAHSLQKIYCKCKQTFMHNSEYLTHLKVCRYMTQMPAPPSMPSQIFETNMTVAQPKQQVCRLCDITFTSNEVYLNHLNIYHKGSSLEQAAPKVKQLQHSGKLWTQVVNKSGEILYNCIICNKKFKQHFSLNSHLRQHKQVPTRRDVCKICSKIFSNSKIFEKHVRGHFLPPNSRKLFCFKCYKTFDHRGEIIAHRATCSSMKMKIYTCGVCRHSFKDTASLKEHKIRAHTHTSILPVQALCTVDIKEDPVPIRTPIIIDENKTCHICNKTFYNFQNMKRHCLTVHKNEDISFLEYGPFNPYDEPSTSSGPSQANLIESQIDQDKWDCEFCKKEFRSEKLLIYHIEHHCPYLQHIPNNIPEKPIERPANNKHRCIICAKFLPSVQNAPNTVCTRCMAKFEGTPQEEQISRKAYLANQSRNLYNALKGPSSSYQNSGVSLEPQVIHKPPLPQPPLMQGNFYQCPIGKKLFTTEGWMVKHYKNCDGSCPSYINCARCNLNFKSITMYEKHVSKCEAGTIKRFDCSLCGKTYSKRDYVIKHKQYAHKKQIRRRPSDMGGVDDIGYEHWIEPVKMEILTNNRITLEEQADGGQQLQSDIEFEQHELDDSHELHEATRDLQDDQTQQQQQSDQVSMQIYGGDGSVLLASNETTRENTDEDMKTFPCEGCSRVFTSHKGLANHSVVHNRINATNKTQFDCKFCQRGDLLQSQVYSHTYRCIKFLLTQEPVVSCKHCQRNFNTSQQTKEFSAQLISHVFECYDIPYYKNEDDGGLNPRLLCYICCYAFSCPDKLRFHKAEHARKSQAKSYSKKAKRKLRAELENSMAAGIEGGVDSYPSPSDYKTDYHQPPPRKIFRDTKLFRCGICNRPFFSINKLKNHEKVHGIIQRNVYSCDESLPEPAPETEPPPQSPPPPQTPPPRPSSPKEEPPQSPLKSELPHQSPPTPAS